MASAFERITGALSALGKRKAPPAPTDPQQSKRHVFRPWDQQDLHRRLETYRPLNWFAKPDIISPIACASKGWYNEARDQLCCDFCHARLIYPANVPFDARQRAAEMFAQQLSTGHQATCPWRNARCEDGVLAFNPASTPATASPAALQQGYQDRLLKLQRLEQLPDMHEPAVQGIASQASSGLMECASPAQQPQHAQHEQPQGPLPQGPSWGANCLRKVLALPAPSDVQPTPPLPQASEPVLPTPAFDPDKPIVLPSKLNMTQKARLLALLGWDAEELPAGTSGRPAHLTPYRPTSEAYTLAHLVGSSNQQQQEGQPDALRRGSSSGGSSGSSRWSMDNVVLNCPSCKSRVGLWNFIPSQPPLLALPAPPPSSTAPADAAAATGSNARSSSRASHAAAGAQQEGEDGAADMEGIIQLQPVPSISLDRTIAGGSFDQSLRASGAKFGAGEAEPVFGNPAATSAPVYGLQALSIPPPAAAAAGQLAAPAGASLKRKMSATAEDVTMDGPGGDGSQQAAAKRLRTTASWGVLQPHAAPLALAGAGAGSSNFDPVGHHRTWCPWVFTGDTAGSSITSSCTAGAPNQGSSAAGAPAGRQSSKCGWMHLLDSLAGDQQGPAAAAGMRDSAAGGAQGTPAPPGFAAAAPVAAAAAAATAGVEGDMDVEQGPQPVATGAAGGRDITAVKDGILATLRGL